MVFSWSSRGPRRGPHAGEPVDRLPTAGRRRPGRGSLPHPQLAQVGDAGLDGDRLAGLALLAAAPADSLVVGHEVIVADGGELDLKVAVLVGDGVIRVVKDPDAAAHPRVDVTLHDDP